MFRYFLSFFAFKSTMQIPREIPEQYNKKQLDICYTWSVLLDIKRSNTLLDRIDSKDNNYLSKLNIDCLLNIIKFLNYTDNYMFVRTKFKYLYIFLERSSNWIAVFSLFNNVMHLDILHYKFKFIDYFNIFSLFCPQNKEVEIFIVWIKYALISSVLTKNEIPVKNGLVLKSLSPKIMNEYKEYYRENKKLTDINKLQEAMFAAIIISTQPRFEFLQLEEVVSILKDSNNKYHAVIWIRYLFLAWNKEESHQLWNAGNQMFRESFLNVLNGEIITKNDLLIFLVITSIFPNFFINLNEKRELIAKMVNFT